MTIAGTMVASKKIVPTVPPIISSNALTTRLIVDNSRAVIGVFRVTTDVDVVDVRAILPNVADFDVDFGNIEFRERIIFGNSPNEFGGVAPRAVLRRRFDS